MENSEQRQHRIRYIKGLLLRIIICCILFLGLFFMKTFQVQIMEVGSNEVFQIIANNKAIDSVEQVFQNLVQ